MIGLYRAQRAGEIIGESEPANRLLELLSADHEQPETSVYLRQAGIDAEDEAIVVAAGFPGRADLQDLALSILADAVAHIARPVVGRDGMTDAVALVPTAGQQAPKVLISEALRRATSGLDDTLNVGLSNPARPEQLGGALRAARHAVRLSAHGSSAGSPESVRVVDASEMGSALHLLTAVPDDLRRVFVGSVLGRVIEHDARYQTQLLPTLRAFLDSGGSWVRTAEATHLHTNSVRHRIARVQNLSGRDLNSTADRADLYLALNLL